MQLAITVAYEKCRNKKLIKILNAKQLINMLIEEITATRYSTNLSKIRNS